MNNSNVFFLLTRVQHLQRYAKKTKITISRDPKSGILVEIKVPSTRYYRRRFAITEYAEDAENEEVYQQIIDTYEQYEQ